MISSIVWRKKNHDHISCFHKIWNGQEFWRISTLTHIGIENQFIAEYIIKCLMLLNRVHIVIEKYTAGCQQTFCWWQPVVTRHFASDNRLSPDILLVTTGCQQTKKVWWQPVVSRPRQVSADNRLSLDSLVWWQPVVTSKKSSDNRLSANLAYILIIKWWFPTFAWWFCRALDLNKSKKRIKGENFCQKTEYLSFHRL